MRWQVATSLREFDGIPAVRAPQAEFSQRTWALGWTGVQRPQHGGNRAWGAAIAGCPAEAILDFSASLNPLGPPQSVLQALARALSASDPVAISRYPDPDYRELRACLAQRWAVDPEWIFVGNGAAELLTWAARDAQGREVWLPRPAFGDYERALRAAGVTLRGLDLLPSQGSPPLGLAAERDPGGQDRPGALAKQSSQPDGPAFPPARHLAPSAPVRAGGGG